MQNATRVDWVDTAKGLGILLVLIGHAPIPLAIKLFIYAFHMPLFFWLGGLFLKPGGEFEPFLRDKTERLFFPYLLTAGGSYLVWLGIRQFSHMASAIDPLTPLLGIFYGVGSGNWMPENTPLWFLPCLMTAIILLSALVRWLGNKVAFGLLVSSMLGYVVLPLLGFRLPWSFDVALTAVVFIGVGFSLRKAWLQSPPMPLWLLALLGLILAKAAWVNASFISGPAGIGMVDMNNGVYGNYILFYLAAFSGILVMVDFAKRLARSAFLSTLIATLGKASLPIFCLHMLVYLFVTVLFTKILHIPLALTYEHLMLINPGLNPALAVTAYVVPGLFLPLGAAKAYDWLKPRLKWPTRQPAETGAVSQA